MTGQRLPICPFPNSCLSDDCSYGYANKVRFYSLRSRPLDFDVGQSVEAIQRMLDGPNPGPFRVRVGQAVDFNVGLPVGLWLASAPNSEQHEWFNVGLPIEEDSAYDLQA